jgi:predicted nuclease with TOPRIM domain
MTDHEKDIENLRLQIDRLRAERDEMQGELRKAETESSMLRVECGVIAAERDEARRSCCEFAAMVDSADTVVMYVDSNRFHEIAMRYMKSRGWDCFKEDCK